MTFTPTASQLERLSDDEYQALLAITMRKLMDIEGRYSIPDIEAMSPEQIADYLESLQLQMDRELEALNDDLFNGGSLKDWEESVAELVVAGALLGLLFLFGGVSGLRNQAIARDAIRQVQATINGQARAIQRNAQKIADGQLSEAQIRAGNYRRASTIREAYERNRIISAINRGHNEGIRLLGSPHPCPDCPLHERRDWVPIEDIVPIANQCVCQSRCKCSVRTRFNPARLAEDIRNGTATNRVARYEERLESGRVEFLSRHGWL